MRKDVVKGPGVMDLFINPFLENSRNEKMLSSIGPSLTRIKYLKYLACLKEFINNIYKTVIVLCSVNNKCFDLTKGPYVKLICDSLKSIKIDQGYIQEEVNKVSLARAMDLGPFLGSFLYIERNVLVIKAICFLFQIIKDSDGHPPPNKEVREKITEYSKLFNSKLDPTYYLNYLDELIRNIYNTIVGGLPVDNSWPSDINRWQEVDLICACLNTFYMIEIDRGVRHYVMEEVDKMVLSLRVSLAAPCYLDRFFLRRSNVQEFELNWDNAKGFVLICTGFSSETDGLTKKQAIEYVLNGPYNLLFKQFFDGVYALVVSLRPVESRRDITTDWSHIVDEICAYLCQSFGLKINQELINYILKQVNNRAIDSWVPVFTYSFKAVSERGQQGRETTPPCPLLLNQSLLRTPSPKGPSCPGQGQGQGQGSGSGSGEYFKPIWTPQ